MTAETKGFLEHLEVVRNLSQRTISAYRRDLCDLEDFVGGYLGRDGCSWDEVDRGVIRAFLGESRRRGLAPATIARKLSAARTFFGHLYHEGVIAVNPARQVRGPKRDRRLPGHMHSREVRDLLRWADDEARAHGSLTSARLRAVLEMLYGSGIRLAELVSLDTSSLDLDGRLVRVLGKGPQGAHRPGHGTGGPRRARLPPLSRPGRRAGGRRAPGGPPRTPPVAALRPVHRQGGHRALRHGGEPFRALPPPLIRDPPPRLRRRHHGRQGAARPTPSLSTTQIYSHTSREHLKARLQGSPPARIG